MSTRLLQRDGRYVLDSVLCNIPVLGDVEFLNRRLVGNVVEIHARLIGKLYVGREQHDDQ
jgi:hypothetical protein